MQQIHTSINNCAAADKVADNVLLNIVCALSVNANSA